MEVSNWLYVSLRHEAGFLSADLSLSSQLVLVLDIVLCDADD